MKTFFKKIISYISILTIVLSIAIIPVSAASVNATYDMAANEKAVYDFLKNTMKVNTAVACGVLANIERESDFNPEKTYKEKDGKISYGICQWNDSRFTALKNYCSKNNLDYKNINAQLKYLKTELEGSYKSKWETEISNKANTQNGAGDAAYNWAKYFEVCDKAYWEQRRALAIDKYWPKYSDVHKVSITYNANGGKISGTSDFCVDSSGYVSRTNGHRITDVWNNGANYHENGLLNAKTVFLSKDNCTFKGWSKNKDGSGTVYSQDNPNIHPEELNSDVKTKDCSVTLYAVWESHKVSINYNANGGKISGTSDFCVDSSGYVSRTNGHRITDVWNYGANYHENGLLNAKTVFLSKDNCTFKGWSKNKDGSGTVYSQDDPNIHPEELNSDVKTKDCSVTLYAVWENNKSVEKPSDPVKKTTPTFIEWIRTIFEFLFGWIKK